MIVLNILILHQAVTADSPPDELDVLEEARIVSVALRSLGHRVSTLPMTGALDDMARALRRRKPDCVFNLVESLLGYGGLGIVATSLLDALRIPYTGNGTPALALSTDKVACKHSFERAKVATPAWVTQTEQVGFRPGRYVFKPVAEDASVGLDHDSLVGVKSLTQCRREISTRGKRLGRVVFAERFIEGREFNVSLLGSANSPKVLPIAELRFEGFRERSIPTIYGYRAKWDTDSFEYRHATRQFDSGSTARALLRLLAQQATKIWSTLGCRGYARVDFRVDAKGVPYALELNANPCLASDGNYYAAAQQAGMDYPTLIWQLVQAAINTQVSA
jgi:D-alanine-D-alanine ligase